MESMLGFKEPNDVVESNFKLVPWLTWDEWKLVRASLFSSSLDSVAFALQRISTWRSRGCVPVAVDVTASIVEIQQKDPFFRNDLDESSSHSEEMLAMLYCMAIVRLVNGVVEKTRKKNQISIGEAADAIGIPRMLIDIRHEGSHRDLPSLQLVRLASTKALEWLISYYWEPQEKEIPVQNKKTANLRKEIKRSLREVSLCLKARQISKLGSSHDKEKRLRKTELLHGHSKFLLLAAGKSSHSNSTGSKKHLTKAVKNTVRLYSSFSTEVVHLLLEYLLNALESSSLMEHAQDRAFDDWKSVVLKLSRKEPELLLLLTQAVLEKMEAMNCETGEHQSFLDTAKTRRFESLSHLLEWLVENLRAQNPKGSKESAETKGSKIEKLLSRATVFGLLRRCLLLSLPGNKQLMSSATTLGHLAGGGFLIQKLKKLASLEQPSLSEEYSTTSSYNTLLSQQEHSFHEAEKKLELLKRHQMHRKNGKPNAPEAGTTNSRWTVAKSWTPCPIGMLPHTIGFSGRVPSLDRVDDHRQPEAVAASSKREADRVLSLDRVDDHRQPEAVAAPSKCKAEVTTEEMDSRPVKKAAAEIEDNCLTQNENESVIEGIEGHLMIDGEWEKVGEEEVLGIASAVRLLI